MARTRLESNSTDPSRTAPGDGAADTTDPLERASTVSSVPGREALQTGTVNGAVAIPTAATVRDSSADRFEIYPVSGPAGLVWVQRNIETGRTRVLPEAEALEMRRAEYEEVLARQAEWFAAALGTLAERRLRSDLVAELKQLGPERAFTTVEGLIVGSDSNIALVNEGRTIGEQFPATRVPAQRMGGA